MTKAEQEISKEIERGDFRPVPEAEKRGYAEAARLEVQHRKSARKTERINIRLSEQNLAQLKTRAEREGLPYQTLVSSVLHKYLSGALVDVETIPGKKSR